MVVKVNRDKCLHCGGCVGICPVNALTLEEGILVVDESKCIKCGTCVKYCPARALSLEE